MVNFYWAGGKWRCREKLSLTTVSALNYKEEQSDISFRHHLEESKEVVVWQDPYGSQRKQISILIEKLGTDDCKIYCSGILIHLAWKSLKYGTWISIA